MSFILTLNGVINDTLTTVIVNNQRTNQFVRIKKSG